jgi:hypothetical protein
LGQGESYPVEYCAPGERKHEIAEEHLSAKQVKPGLFLILVSKAPALVWEAQRTGTGKLGQLVSKDPWPYVNHYFLSYPGARLGTRNDQNERASALWRTGGSEWTNGREYLAVQARRAGIEFTKQQNCFTSVSNTTGLAKIAGTLSEKETAGRLRQLCECWIYSTCLCFALDLDLAEQEKSRFEYQYSVFQMKYSRNLLFHSDRQMDQDLPGADGLDARAVGPGSDQDHLRRQRTGRIGTPGKRTPLDGESWSKKPTYDLTVFKVHYGKMTLKIYTKGARVLRVEVIVHNTREYRWGRSLSCFAEIVTCRQPKARFTDQTQPSDTGRSAL